MVNTNKKKLIVIGAGYAGITLIKNLKKNKNLEITLIDKSAYHLHQTDIHKYISGEADFKDVAFDLHKFSQKNNCEFILSKVDDICFDDNEVILDNKKSLSYDYLVIATGSISFFPKQIKNIDEYAKDIKDINILKNMKQEFLDLVDSKKENKNIAIVGAGLSGIEIALEFANVLKKRNISENECRVSLVEQYHEILPNMDSYLVNETSKKCDEFNIKRYHGNFVNEVKNNKIYLSNKEEIDFDMIVFLIGVTSEKVSSDENIGTNIKNQFTVNKYLQLENKKNVFVMGDIAETKSSDGKYTLPTAQMAKLHGNLVSQNIINTLENVQLVENNLRTKGVMIDLARNKAVGLIQSFKVKGYLAYSLKRFVSNSHMKIFK